MRFPLRTQLLVLSLGLLILPWLGYRYIADIQTFLVKGQEQAQLLTTQAIATALQDRPELLTELPTKATGSRQTLLYAYPTDSHVLADGYAEEWQKSPDRFGPNTNADKLDPLALELRFLQRGNQLYLLAKVEDHYPVYRHPGFQRLDTSDQLRLTIDNQQIIIAAEGVGTVQVIHTNARWRYAQPRAQNSKISGSWIEVEGGYQIELEMPLSLVANASRFEIEALDVDDPQDRNILDRVRTAGADGSRLLVHSPELQQIIRGLKRNNRHVWILDRKHQIRAVSNTRDASPNILQRHTTVIARALSGLPALAHYQEANKEYILAAQPIVDKQGAPLGAAVVEMATDEILDLQRATLIKSALATGVALTLLIAGLLFFGYRLTRRIRRLQKETRDITDLQGRIVKSELKAETNRNDELGDLARDYSSLVSRLSQYTQFLERMPRTLRHELSNPLNTISTSIQILQQQENSNGSEYLSSAQRGVNRLTLIIESLTEAASLEDSLRSEHLEPVYLNQLLEGYFGYRRLGDDGPVFKLQLPKDNAEIAGNSVRIEQLLDKLVDNAVDFSAPCSNVLVSLSKNGSNWSLKVCNNGPAIPESIRDSLFDSLVTARSIPKEDSCHLGIGLFVVKTIAEHHHASVTAHNTEAGVCFEVVFPADFRLVERLAQ